MHASVSARRRVARMVVIPDRRGLADWATDMAVVGVGRWPDADVKSRERRGRRCVERRQVGIERAHNGIQQRASGWIEEWSDGRGPSEGDQTSDVCSPEAVLFRSTSHQLLS